MAKKNKEKEITVGGFIQHPDTEALPDVIMQLPQLFYYDTYQWTIAVNSAKTWDWTRRKALYDMYESCMLDSHLLAIIEQRRVAMSKFPIHFVRNGEPDEAINVQIRAPWFRSFLKSLLDEKLYGFAAYQFVRREDGWISYTQIDNRHIQPHTKEVLQLPTDATGVPLEDFGNTLFVGSGENIGILATAVPWVLWKRQSVGDWVQFSQIFGMPIREYTYSAGDEKSRQQLIQDAMTQGANAVYIHPDTSSLKLSESGNKSGSAELYKSLRDTCNEELSLLVLGNTLTSTSADHGTQALGTVHEQQKNEINEDDRGFVLDVLNYFMTDIFKNLGINTDGGEFVYKEDKKIDPYAQINIVTQLHNMGLPMSDDYLYETFNIEKPTDYEQQKKAKEELKTAMQKAMSEQNMNAQNISATAQRAFGFFGNARLNKAGDENLDW